MKTPFFVTGFGWLPHAAQI